MRKMEKFAHIMKMIKDLMNKFSAQKKKTTEPTEQMKKMMKLQVVIK
jgi:hypothetical protein